MTRRRRTVVAVAVLVALSRSAAADDAAPAPAPPPPAATSFLHVSVPWHLSTDSGTKLDLPPSYVLDEPSYSKLDAEMKRLQDAETRLTAENGSLKTAVSGWQPGWWTLATTVVVGIGLGWYAHDKI